MSVFLFSFSKRFSDARGGCFPTPPPPTPPGTSGGGGRRRGPAAGAFPTTCQFYCCGASESLRISAGRPSVRRTPNRPSPRPWRPPRRPGSFRRAPGGGVGLGAPERGQGRVPKLGRETASCGNLLVAPGPRRGARGFTDLARAPSSPASGRAALEASGVLEVSPALFLLPYASLYRLTLRASIVCR